MHPIAEHAKISAMMKSIKNGRCFIEDAKENAEHVMLADLAATT
jgi:anthranilate/para-aminobenzoate synthase component I